MNFSTGIGAGFAIGFAAGIAAGRNQAGKILRSYVENNNLTVMNSTGEIIPTEELLNEALKTDFNRTQKVWALSMVLGLTLLLGIVVFFLIAAQ